MEMNFEYSLGKRSLPEGDRQGISGAGAGYDSMRDVGGRVLRRRAPVVQEATAPQQSGSQTTTSATAAESAAQESQPVLTQAGLPRRRIKWTVSMNESIMRIFYKVTNLGRETIGYRPRLHTAFCSEYPEIKVSQQRVADQYRVIIKNNLIPQPRLNAIKQEVQLDLMQQEGSNNEIRDNGQSEQEQIESEQPGVDDSNDQDTEIFGILITEMGRAYAEFDGTNPLERPPLPKLKSSRKLAVVLCQLNKQILPEYLAHSNCIEQLHTLIYCAAVATVRTLGVKMPTQKITENSVKPITPKWEKRLERRTAEIRRDIGRLTQFTRGITTRKVRKQAMEIMQRLHHHSHQDATNINEWQCLDTLKQKLSVYTQRLKRYKASSHRKHDNALFQRSEKAFYRKLSSEPQEKSKTVPTKDQVEEFWGKQFGSTAYYNKCAGWITDEEAKSHYCNPMQYRAYTKQEIVDIDQVIPTNNYKRFILKNLQQSDKCRYGCQDSETIQHVTGGCQAFAPTDYKERHDIAAKIIHQELAYKFKLIECKLQYYKYTPQCVLENDKYKLYWDRTVLTDQYVKQNRPDIIIVDKDAQKVTLIDVAIPNNPTKKPRLPKLFCNPTAAKNLREMNRIIAADISDQTDFKDLHAMIYAGAFAVLKLNDQRPTDVTSRKGTKRQPAWERRLSKNIDNIRSDIAILTQYQKPTYSQRVKKKGDTIMRRYTSEENPTIVEVLDLLKQRLLALSQRVKRYKKSSQRRKQNILFHRNQRAFYKSVGKESDRTLQGKTSFPNTEDIRHFWSGIWSNPREHRTAHWYQQEKARTSIQAMLSWTITKDDVVKAIGRTSNWRAPGPDGVHNYWIKAFTSTHQQLAKCYSTFLERPETIPEFLTTGVTYLIPKTEQYTADPAKYRPITCLSTAYKLLTAILADKVHNHLERNNLLDEEQKGCRKGSRGCKEQLIIDEIITGSARKKKSPLFTAYIDYQKAFDSIPHSWLTEVLHLYGIENHIVKLLTYAMSKWKTRLCLNTPDSQIDAGEVSIKRGIFQGDSLSPLWFCLALRPLTSLLNSQEKGVKIAEDGTQLSHLWYMDDLKLFAEKKVTYMRCWIV
ncbi:unnamed protein product [Acanthoscelides obtectus]|uniref:Reverse transcriptase domain-containing protein n=1 Tax=Acanthoscelides obtectus TaxID=200917 RepID=A0A9P0QC44_ACAOB|nr:unnamed protein product [Acanthoscelides obtectus]CAK1682797.1 hypothetical protein AOBTE_LOCUS33891 [Acanthoscelides obtectus]